MLINRLPRNPFAYIGMQITRWFQGANRFAPHLHVGIYCSVIGSVRVWPIPDWPKLGQPAFHWLRSLMLFYVCMYVLWQTDYFHLFLCVAIIVLYGDDVTEQQLATDQMLLHFSNLSMHMNGELVLRKVHTHTHTRAEALMVMDAVLFVSHRGDELLTAAYKIYFSYSHRLCSKPDFLN